jgi:hypothetical protein
MYTFRNEEWNWPPKQSRKGGRHEALTIRLTATVVRSRPSLSTRITNAYVPSMLFIVKFLLGIVLSFIVIASIWLMIVLIHGKRLSLEAHSNRCQVRPADRPPAKT